MIMYLAQPLLVCKCLNLTPSLTPALDQSWTEVVLIAKATKGAAE